MPSFPFIFHLKRTKWTKVILVRYGSLLVRSQLRFHEAAMESFQVILQNENPGQVIPGEYEPKFYANRTMEMRVMEEAATEYTRPCLLDGI